MASSIWSTEANGRLKRPSAPPWPKWVSAVNQIVTNRSLAPGGKRLSERALARIALFERYDGAAAIVVDHRHVEPRAFLEKLEITLLLGVHRGKAEQEEARRDLHGEAGQRGAAGLLRLLHQDAGDARDPAEGKIGRDIEHDLHRVTRRQRLVQVAAQRKCHAEPPLGNLDLAADGKLRTLSRAG